MERERLINPAGSNHSTTLRAAGEILCSLRRKENFKVAHCAKVRPPFIEH
jgi:hypothetical protein